MAQIEHQPDEAALNIASSLGVSGEPEAILQFAADMKAAALMSFAHWARTSGGVADRVSWADVAINAELCAAELCPVTL